jgi:hypothetical protein
MKLLLLFGCCLCSSAIFAQYKSPKVFKYDAFAGDSLKLKMFPLAAIRPQPGVYHLPIDRMPCIVPDLHASVSIPNAWKGPVLVPFNSQIPNPALPKQEQKEKNLKTK